MSHSYWQRGQAHKLPGRITLADAASIAGMWVQPGIGSYLFKGTGSQYRVTAFNNLGFVSGEGMAFMEGKTLRLQGWSGEVGPWSAEFTAAGNALVGAFILLGVTCPATLVRG